MWKVLFNSKNVTLQENVHTLEDHTPLHSGIWSFLLLVYIVSLHGFHYRPVDEYYKDN